MDQKIAPGLNPDREKARIVHARLLVQFGLPEWKDQIPPLDQLISTILSQNTNDLNRDRAFHALKENFISWEAVRDANPYEVIQTIRVAGLENQKGPRIQTILKEITAVQGNLDISFLVLMSPEDAKTWLMKYKGVGPKTAAIVLLFSLNKPAFPVDTHIYRVTGRLGIRPATMDVGKAHQHLSQVFSPDSYSAIHLNLIRLGREICHARRPDCQACPLQDICDDYKARQQDQRK